MIMSLGWRNLWRNRRRTIIILLAMALGVWSMIMMSAFMRGMIEQVVDDAVNNLTGHIQVHAPAYRDDPVIENSMSLPSAKLRQALQHPAITAWAARIRVPAVIVSESESTGVTLIGIDPAKEKSLSFIGDAVKQGRYLKDTQDKGLLLGKKLAERLETKLGRRVVIMSQDKNNEIADRGYRVHGTRCFPSPPGILRSGL